MATSASPGPPPLRIGSEVLYIRGGTKPGKDCVFDGTKGYIWSSRVSRPTGEVGAWRCKHTKKSQKCPVICPGRLYLRLGLNELLEEEGEGKASLTTPVISFTPHSPLCPEDPNEAHLRLFNLEVKRQALEEPRKAPSNIHADALIALTEQGEEGLHGRLAAQLPSNRNLRRQVASSRKKAGVINAPADPDKSLEHYDVPAKYKAGGETPFLVFDSWWKEGNKPRFMIFALPADGDFPGGIKLASQSDQRHFDGTFQTVSRQWGMLYTIAVRSESGHHIPAIFILSQLSAPNANDYKRIFKRLDTLCPGFWKSMRVYVADFERAPQRFFKKLDRVQIQLCRFHLSQNIQKRATRGKGMAALFSRDYEINPDPINHPNFRREDFLRGNFTLWESSMGLLPLAYVKGTAEQKRQAFADFVNDDRFNGLATHVAQYFWDNYLKEGAKVAEPMLWDASRQTQRLRESDNNKLEAFHSALQRKSVSEIRAQNEGRDWTLPKSPNASTMLQNLHRAATQWKNVFLRAVRKGESWESQESVHAKHREDIRNCMQEQDRLLVEHPSAIPDWLIRMARTIHNGPRNLRKRRAREMDPTEAERTLVAKKRRRDREIRMGYRKGEGGPQIPLTPSYPSSFLPSASVSTSSVASSSLSSPDDPSSDADPEKPGPSSR